MRYCAGAWHCPAEMTLARTLIERCGVQMSWAVQGINNLSYNPLPPLPPSANASGRGLHITISALESSSFCLPTEAVSTAADQVLY